MKRYLGQGLVGALLGFTLVLQARTLTLKEALAVHRTQTTEEIVTQLIQVGKERDRLQEELRILRDMATQQATRNRLQGQVLQEQAASGLVPVEGRGVIVTLGDLQSSTRVLVKDVLMVLNELRASGAEVMAVGKVRLTERTRIAPATGGGVAVDGTPLREQIIISAIGEPEVLAAGLSMRGGVMEELRNYYPVSVMPSPQIRIGASEAPAAHRYARPVR